MAKISEEKNYRYTRKQKQSIETPLKESVNITVHISAFYYNQRRENILQKAHWGQNVEILFNFYKQFSISKKY